MLGRLRQEGAEFETSLVNIAQLSQNNSSKCPDLHSRAVVLTFLMLDPLIQFLLSCDPNIQLLLWLLITVVLLLL